mgnify:CR=1 FL=1|tara:strand:- start:2138 stop:2761 length:624 start_codon:yes stop_codon:yes gene_type:complete
MSIEIKKSIKPVKYDLAINYLEYRVKEIISKKSEKELIWFLEHPSIFTGGSSFKEYDILDNSIKITKTSRGGKITWHGPGQLVCYFVIDLNKRKRDLRKFINIIENSIIKTLNDYKILSSSDRKNIGIWYKKENQIFKVAAIGIKVKRWVAYHGFSLNINNDLKSYKKIIPCGIRDKAVTNLINIKKQNYNKIINKLEKNLVNCLKI